MSTKFVRRKTIKQTPEMRKQSSEDPKFEEESKGDEEDEIFFDAVEDIDPSLITFEPAFGLRTVSETFRRPTTEGVKNVQAIEWWKYAVTCVVKDIRVQRGKWNEFSLTNWRKKHY